MLLEGIDWRRPVRSYDPQIAVQIKRFSFFGEVFNQAVKQLRYIPRDESSGWRSSRPRSTQSQRTESPDRQTASKF